MAEVNPLKLVNQGGGVGALAEFAAGDTLPNSSLSINLAAFGGLAGLADRLPYFTGAGALSLATLTESARTLLAANSPANQRVALELGTAATATLTTSDTDSTAGRVIKVGDFGGNGGSAIVRPATADLNQEKTPGLYAYASGAINRPGTSWFPVVMVIRHTSSRFVRQIAYDLVESKVATRQCFNDVWTPWVEMYTQGSILGTVSQSAGVPTGAIIERGSNANGEYVRFADGTQENICKVNIDFTNFTSQLSGSVWVIALNIPAAFSSNGLIAGSVSMLQAGYSANANRFLTRIQVNISAAGAPTLYRIDNADMVNAAETREIRVSVRGRWY